MIDIRRGNERGVADHGWLHSRHTFSFADYYDPRFMGFGALRVINEDLVEPGQGFATHPHRDMEIISYVVAGALEHRDSMGHGSVIRPGEVQRLSAGTGVTHSEFNSSDAEAVHFLQIWIQPRERGLPPSYEQRAFPPEEREGRLRLVASPDGRDGSLTIHQDAFLYDTTVGPETAVEHRPEPGRRVWVQVVRGTALVNGMTLTAGDGAGIGTGAPVTLEGITSADLLLFDLA